MEKVKGTNGTGLPKEVHVERLNPVVPTPTEAPAKGITGLLRKDQFKPQFKRVLLQKLEFEEVTTQGSSDILLLNNYKTKFKVAEERGERPDQELWFHRIVAADTDCRPQLQVLGTVVATFPCPQSKIKVIDTDGQTPVFVYTVDEFMIQHIITE